MKTTTPGKQQPAKRRKRSVPPTPFKAVPRQPHVHGMTVIRKRRGNMVRMGCFFCPKVDPWKKVLFSKAGDPAAWKYDSDGFTIDETPMRMDLLGQDTMSVAQMTGIINKPGITVLSDSLRADAAAMAEKLAAPYVPEPILIHPNDVSLLNKLEETVIDGEHPHADIEEPVIEPEDIEDEGFVYDPNAKYDHDNTQHLVKHEVYQIACERNIKGRSRMTRFELIDAIMAQQQ